ncbi:hypothetical protein ATSB10_16250 [Dyella thiooxydans]|uniref:Uncharacterized protein n=1 Tax=Dyella thiooxydans TaxID=445710 RepID=A0A161J1Z3_9GAMM|nr:hypothetical protein ATSB10_16250 [Dyella thiooxydans]
MCFSGGGESGLGAESLTIERFVVHGEGQVRHAESRSR